MAGRALVSDSAARLRIADEIATAWSARGIDGHLHARNLDTGEELGFGVDRPTPLASVVKVPLALVVLDLIARGELDAAAPVELVPATNAAGSTGAAAFAHPARIAVGDLVVLALTVSDNASADRLLELVGIDTVDRAMAAWGHPQIRVRHPMQPLYEAAVDAAGKDVELALELAIASEESGVHSIAMLDPDRANTGTARALVELLADVWNDGIADPGAARPAPAATAELRRVMRMQVFTQRLSGDLRSDAVRVAGKTGTFLHLRHEIGVVESHAGDRIAIAALTRSARRAVIAADVDLAIGTAARSAFEALRGDPAD